MKLGRKIRLTFSAALLLCAALYGQSLGDVARQQRAQQASQPQPTKVLTNDDLPNGGKPADDPGLAADKATSPKYNDRSSNGAYKLPPEQWKAQILAMKSNITAMQNQIEQTKSSVHFVSAGIYRNGVQHNQQQEQKLEQIDRAQAQLESMKKQLEDAQEAARKQGYGSSVYDP